MAKKFRSRGAHLTALMTGMGAEPGPIETRERAVFQITRRITSLELKRKGVQRKIAQLKKQITAINEEIRAQRHGLRVVLQRGEEIPTSERS